MSDGYSRALLSLITLLLLVIVAQELGLLSGSFGSGRAEEREARFSVVAIRAPGGPVLIRTDTATGKVWKRNVRDEQAGWALLEEEPSEAGDESASSGTGASPSPQAAGAELKGSAVASPPRSEKDIEGIVELLKDPEPDVRVWACQQLGRVAPERALAPLTRALGDPEPQVVIAAIGSLRKLGDPRALPELGKLSEHPNPDVQTAALGAVKALQ
jgi:hypothetical protein